MNQIITRGLSSEVKSSWNQTENMITLQVAVHTPLVFTVWYLPAYLLDRQRCLGNGCIKNRCSIYDNGFHYVSCAGFLDSLCSQCCWWTIQAWFDPVDAISYFRDPVHQAKSWKACTGGIHFSFPAATRASKAVASPVGGFPCGW